MGSLISVLGNSSRAFFQAVLGVPPRLTLIGGGRLSRLASLLALFSRSDEHAESLLAEKFSLLQIQGDLNEYEAKALDRLRDIMALRSLAFAKATHGKTRLRQGFVFRRPAESVENFVFSTQDIMESATVVTELYWKLLDTCLGHIPEIQSVGLQLYFQLFNVPFEETSAKARLTRLTDAIQRDNGIPFLMLNLIKQGALREAREIGRHLVADEVVLSDEELPTALYWFAEISWFNQAWAAEKLTHETALRMLYHLCFTNPDRAGFLEIDSPFYSEFVPVNELAEEAFSYREVLFENILDLWKIFDHDFDALFQKVLESLAGKASKIYDQRVAWEKLWVRVQEDFSRDYLFVVEGNLSYAAGLYEDAAESYEAALRINPDLRPALLNLVFAYARLNRTREQRALADRILADRRLMPAALSVLGNSFLLCTDEDSANDFYERLRTIEGWENKVDYYKSTFCFHNGMFGLATRFARLACAINPKDAAMAHHLSLCYNAIGEKDHALETLEKLESASKLSWLQFYRFTLERDLGNDTAASETLLKIPSDYFDDEEELEAALSFARSRQDIGLMRHLRRKNPAKN